MTEQPSVTPVRSSGPQALLRAWWQEIMTFAPDTSGPGHAVRVSVAVSAPLGLLLALGHPELTSHAVFGALSSVYGKNHAPGDRLRAQLLAAAALTIAVSLGALVGVTGPASAWSVLLMSFLAVAGYLMTRRFGLLPVPSLFLVFAAGTTSFIPRDWGGAAIAFAVAAVSSLFGVLIGQTGGLFTSSRPKNVTVPQSTSLRKIFRAPGARTQMLQYTLGPLIAGGTATALGLGHPYWAAVSATVPLAGAALAAQLSRATLRLVGTLLGIGLAALMITLLTQIWMLVVMVALLQIIIELTVARNYGIAVVCITPSALILSHLAAPTPVNVLVADRFVETALGVAVATAVLLIRFPQRRIQPALSQTEKPGLSSPPIQ
ncbi:FUSC family protein [Paenarthrobacter sp. TYUT067]|uniref:FUSC family protein n=1 Tax=Paenarthrobacter sp. TYUT067 TaxID=2926245 RepID=UPI00202F4DFE|nr:FUSC family protein [Paenarthrobacter sp. TYUT067]MCM0614977.1 FUSC family protein [Paenarthrobacter sp. TYUT067]